MLGENQWFTFKSKDTIEREDVEYEKWAFPHGEEQRRKIEALLAELFPKERASSRMISFLTCKELFDSMYKGPGHYNAAIEELQRGIKRYSNIVRKKDAPLYAALAVADVRITPSLEYPSKEELMAWANDFGQLPEPKKRLFQR